MAEPRLIFVGSKKCGLDILTAIAGSVCGVVTIDDRQDGRSCYDAIRHVAGSAGLPLEVAHGAGGEERILSLRPDVCIVSGWYRILRPEFLKKIPGGVVGIHHSLLPKHRGGAPLVWTLINGEREVGTSLFYLAEGTDDGDIVDQRAIPVTDDESIGEVLARLEPVAVRMVAENLEAIRQGKARRKAQDHQQASYGALRKPEDGRVDWTWDARRLHNFIRAQSDPYPGAWTTLDGEQIWIWRAAPDVSTHPGTIGQVVRVSPEGVTVSCGEGTALLLIETQRGKTRGAASKLIPLPGWRLGG
jgi:methionyl-tRNA formyltransferase